MQKKLLSGLVCACFVSPVFADSSISIYGIADAGFHITSNGEGTKTKLTSGLADGSRLGFKGVEDLGGGYKTIFQLEMRVELDTGKSSTGALSDNQGYYLTKGMGPLGTSLLPKLQVALQPTISVNIDNAPFDRMSMLGVITPVGAILAGRMYTPGYEVLAASDTFEAGTAGSMSGLVTGTGGFTSLGVDIRTPKAIQYRIQLPNGLNGAVMYGFKSSGYFARYDKFYGGNVTYKANGFDVGLGYNRGTDASGNRSLVTTTLGGSYKTGNMKFFASYHDMKNAHSALLPDFIAAWDGSIAPSLASTATALRTAAALRNVYVTNITENTQFDANVMSVGMHYHIGNGRIMGSVTHENDRTISNSDATQYAIGYDYNLSKRTDVYTVLGYIKNQNDGQYAATSAGSPGGFTSKPGQSGKALQLGIRHRF